MTERQRTVRTRRGKGASDQVQQRWVTRSAVVVEVPQRDKGSLKKGVIDGGRQYKICLRRVDLRKVFVRQEIGEFTAKTRLFQVPGPPATYSDARLPFPCDGLEVIALIIGTVAVGQHCTLDAVCRCKGHFPAGQHAGVALVTDGVDPGTFFVVDVKEVKGVEQIVRIELLVDPPIYALTSHAQMPLLAVHVEVKSVKDGERGCCLCLKPGDVQR